MATDFQQAIGYPMLLAFLGSDGHSLARAVDVQLVISCLVPIAVGLLGAAAYGRRTGLLAVVFASLYFPFIEYGALFLTEIHFIFCLALAFAGFFAARRARRAGRRDRVRGGRRVRAVARHHAQDHRAARRVRVLRRRWRGAGPRARPRVMRRLRGARA